MLDGFDELPEADRHRVSHWISEQMQEYDQSIFILTSRPSGYEDYVATRPATPLTIQDFSPEQQADFVTRWYLCQERCFHDHHAQRQAKESAERKTQDLIKQLQDPNRPELQELSKNPLLLNMLTTFHRFDVGIQLPRRKVELYKNICKLQLEDRPRARGIKMLLPTDKSQSILQLIALGLLKSNCISIKQSNLLSFLEKQPVFAQEEVLPRDFLRRIETVSELLVQRDLGEYEFPHLSFLGYFAASYLEQQGEAAYEIVLQNWDKSSWRETILFYTAQLPPKRFTEMLAQVCQRGVDAAKLAYGCLREYRSPEKVDPTWENRLKALMVDVRHLLYQNLENYLKNKQWYEADQETWQLMLKITDREEERWLREDDIKTFCCEDLLILDRL
ncbi:serine/threonine kinase [Pseudanabaena sp. lw0831]|nr:serine/threonine kinase [Pseudanabaena sp. lw0831]